MSKYKFDTFENSLLREKYFKYTHSCGLDIYVFPKKLSSTYALLGTRYGSIDNSFASPDSQGVTEVPDGVAHFLEHKLFANEDGSDAFEHFSALGADANAYTSFNKTAYIFSCTDSFSDSLEVLIDFVYHPYFTEESIKKERGIIAQEIRMYEDYPGEACYYGMLEGLYEFHSIKRNICGTVESIEQISPNLLYDCFSTFYNPSNMVLIVCGDVSPDSVIETIDKHLPRKVEGPDIIKVPNQSLEEPSAFLPRKTKSMKVSKPIFNIGIKDIDIPSSPKERQRKDAAMSILNEMLFARAGSFYSELFENGMISPEMSYCYTISSSFAFTSIAGEADDPEAVFVKMKDYLRKLSTEGLSIEDFERGKKVMYAEFVKEFDSTENIANLMFSFIADGYELFDYTDVILNTKFEDVCELFKKSFCDEYFTMSVVYPLDKTV